MFLKLGAAIAQCWGRAAGYQPPPQVADRGTTSRYGGQLQTKQTLSVWRISSGGPAAAESSERGGGRRVAPPTAIKYPQVPRRLCVMASTSRQKSSKATIALRLGLYNQRLGEGPRQKTKVDSCLWADAEWTTWTAIWLPCICPTSYHGKLIA